jgi:hypothetical protein
MFYQQNDVAKGKGTLKGHMGVMMVGMFYG